MSRFIRSAVIRNKARKEALKREQIDKRYTKTVGMIQYIKPNPLTAEERKEIEDYFFKTYKNVNNTMFFSSGDNKPTVTRL